MGTADRPIVIRGLSNIKIANTLGISEITTRHHLSSIFRKLEVPNRFRLALFVFGDGLSQVSTEHFAESKASEHPAAKVV